MSCIIETYYGQYIVCSLVPISTNTLCYGSNTLGAHITNNDTEIENLLSEIASLLNLKKHKVAQLCDESKVEMILPYNVQIHKYDLNNTKKSYLIHMPYRLWYEYSENKTVRQEIVLNHR